MTIALTITNLLILPGQKAVQMTVSIPGVKPSAIRPVGQPARSSDQAPRQWSIDVTGLEATLAFHGCKTTGSEVTIDLADELGTMKTKQDSRRIVVEMADEGALGGAPSTGAAVLLTGAISFPDLSGSSEFVQSLVPPGVRLRALLAEPSGLHVVAELPAAGFAAGVTDRVVVLRVPQLPPLDVEHFDSTGDRTECWTMTDKTFPESQWTARLWLDEFQKALEEESENPKSIVDSVASRRESREPDNCVVRFGRTPASEKEVRWVARGLELEVSLAAGSGASRTREVRFRPDVLIGSFDEKGQATVPTQLQSIPRRDGRRPTWTADFGDADYLVELADTPIQKLKQQSLVAFRGPVFENRDDPERRPHDEPKPKEGDKSPQPPRVLEQAWLGLADGWLSLAGPDLRGELDPQVSGMRQLVGNLDPVAWSLALTPDLDLPPQMRLQLSAIDHSGPADANKKSSAAATRGTRVALTIPFAGRLRLGLWDPQVVLTTPPFWRKRPAAPPTNVDGAAARETADRLVPPLAPPVEAKWPAFDPVSNFSHFVFVSDRAMLEAVAVKVTLEMKFGEKWRLSFPGTKCEAWRLPENLPMAANHPLVDAPPGGLTLDDRRGLVPFTTSKEVWVDFLFVPPDASSGTPTVPATSQLPNLADGTTNWSEAGWSVAPRLAGADYFLTTLAGVEWPLAAGLTKLPPFALRHANPALDESYARVTEDKVDRLRDLRLEADTTRVEEAVAFRQGEKFAQGWVHGTKAKLEAKSDALTGLAPHLAFTVGEEKIEITLERPTTAARQADLVHLGLTATWSETFEPPAFGLTAFNPKDGGIVGGGQPLVVKPIVAGKPVWTLDGRGDLSAAPDGGSRLRQIRGGKPRTLVTETRTLGDAALGDDLVLEVSASLGRLDEMSPRQLREERWQLHGAIQPEPRFRGFVVRPVALVLLEETSVTLRLALTPPYADAQSRREVTIRFEAGPKVTILEGGIDWVFADRSSAMSIAQVSASFAETVVTSAEVKLTLDCLTVAFPFGRAEMRPTNPSEGDCVFRPDAGDTTHWLFACRANHSANHPLDASDPERTADAPHLQHATSWALLRSNGTPEDLDEDLDDFSASLKFSSNKPASTNWEIKYGQSALVRPSDVFRFKFPSEVAPPEPFKSAAPFAAELAAALEDGDRRGVLRSRIQFLVDELVKRLNEWVQPKGAHGWAELAALAAGDAELTAWIERRRGLPESPLDLERARRTMLEHALSDGTNVAWRRRWHTRLYHPSLPEQLSVIGDAVLEPVRLGATRHVFLITRDVSMGPEHRKQLSRHLQIDALGGVLGAEVLRHGSEVYLANVAVQLQLVLRDRQRRDALGICKLTASNQLSSFQIREDQIGDVQAFAGFTGLDEKLPPELIWATSNPNGSTSFNRWLPKANRLESLSHVKLDAAPGAPPRRVELFHPYLDRDALVIDDDAKASILPLVNLNDPTKPAGPEAPVVPPGGTGPVLKMATNYPFAGNQAVWFRADRTCWRRDTDTDIDPVFVGKEIVSLWFGAHLLAATTTEVFEETSATAVVSGFALIRQITSLKGAALIVAHVRESKAKLNWYAVTKFGDVKTATPLIIDLPFADVDQIMPLGPGRCAVLHQHRVIVVVVGGDGKVELVEIDSGSLVPDEIDLLDATNKQQFPEGDLLLRGPASRTLCTAILSYDRRSEPRIELSGKLVLQNDVRFFRKTKVGDEIVEADCTHRLDLFLDRANLPVSLLFGPPTKEVHVAGVAQHVFRFPDGVERIWQAPQLVRFTSFAAIAPRLWSANELADLRKDPKFAEFEKDLVIDASSVAWVQPFPKSSRDEAAPPFDPFARGGTEIFSPIFRMQLHSKPRGDFNDARLLRMPFVASTAFAKLGRTDAVPPPKIEVTAAEKPLHYESGAQFALLSPRLVDPTLQVASERDGFLAEGEPADSLRNTGIDFLARTHLGSWVDSRFLQYSLLPEPADLRHAVAGSLQNEIPLTSVSPPSLLWPGFEKDTLPKELSDLDALAGDPPAPRPWPEPQRGDRRFLAAATLARKTVDGRLSGPSLVEFPFHVGQNRSDAIDNALDSPGQPLPHIGEVDSIDAQLIVYDNGRIFRLARETLKIGSNAENATDAEATASSPLLAWGRLQKRRHAWVGEAFVVRDFETLIPIEPDPSADVEQLPAALTLESNLSSPADPRCVPIEAGRFEVGADLTPVVYAAKPLTDPDGFAPPHSATTYHLARADTDEPSGSLRPARPLDKAGGFTGHHHTPFELRTRDYPTARPDRVDRVEAAPVQSVQPPTWQLVAWSDRPGELMTSSFRVMENRTAGAAAAVSAEQSFTLRRSRTATRAGASVRLLAHASPDRHASWAKFFKAAFVPRHFRLEQTLDQATIPKGDARLFFVDRESVTASAPTAAASAANPMLINKGEEESTMLYVVGHKDWHPVAEKATVVYVIRIHPLGKADEPSNEESLSAAAKTKFDGYKPDPLTAFFVDRLDNQLFQLKRTAKDFPIPEAGATFTLTKVELQPSTPGNSRIIVTPMGAVSAATVDPRSRIRPLKSSVAILGHVEEKQVRLAGYGQISPEEFTPIEPFATNDERIEWRRSAVLGVMERNPLLKWRYSAVVTGPGGETFPFLPDGGQ